MPDRVLRWVLGGGPAASSRDAPEPTKADPVAFPTHFGVQINCDVRTAPHDDDERRRLRELLLEHGLLLIRGVPLDLAPAEEDAFMRIFPYDDKALLRDLSGPYFSAGTGILDAKNKDGSVAACAKWKIPSHPVIQLQGCGRVENHHGLDGELKSRWPTHEWHTDGPHDAPKTTLPPVATSMFCVETPRNGGETLFKSARTAFDTLTESDKEKALRMDAVYDAHFRPMTHDGTRAESPVPTFTDKVTNRWPLVIEDRSGAPSLYVGPAFTRYLVDVETDRQTDPEETQAFLGSLVSSQKQQQNVYAHEWRPGDLVVWDNRRMLHSATPSDAYDGQRRLIHRVRMASAEPVRAFGARDDLSLYATLWALQQLLSSGVVDFVVQLFSNVFSEDSSSSSTLSLASKIPIKTASLVWLLWPLYVAVFLRPQSLRLLKVAHAVNLVAHARKLPFVWDYEFWDALMEVSVLGFRSKTDAKRAIRAQLCLLYLATAFYKLTKTFFDPSRSCAPIFVLGLLESVLPTSLSMPASFLRLLARLSAPATVLIEALIPTLLFSQSRTSLGLCVGSLFHLLIAVAPPPNNAAGFSVSIAVRYAAFVTSRDDDKLPTSWTFLATTGGVIAAAIAVAKAHGNDWALVIYVCMVLTLFRRIIITTTAKKQNKTTTRNDEDKRQSRRLPTLQKPFFWFMLALTSIYAWLLPILGWQDMGASSMFANLRVFAGSNHLLVPTGLSIAPKTLRVEKCTSSAINAIHPNDATDVHSTRLNEWLSRAGHSTRQFAPYVRRAIGLSFDRPPVFPYLLPDLELRRLVQEAIDAGETEFKLEYVKLDSGGDRVVYEHRGRNKPPSCRVLVNGTTSSSSSSRRSHPCDPDTEPVLNPGLTTFLADKTLLYFSFPVDQHNRDLGCVC